MCNLLLFSFVVGHLIDQLIKSVIANGDEAAFKAIESHLKYACGIQYFRFVETKSDPSASGPEWESGGKYSWMSFSGDQLDQVSA